MSNIKLFKTFCKTSLGVGSLLLIFFSSQVFSAPFQLNTTTAFNQRDANLAINSDGDFIFVWTSEVDNQEPATGSGTPTASIIARRYDTSTTSFLDAETVIDGPKSTAVDGTSSEVGMNSNGSFIIGWSADDAFSGTGIFSRTGSFGTGLGAGSTSLSAAAMGQQSPAVDINSSGSNVVSWSSFESGNYDIEQKRNAGALIDVAGTATAESPSDTAIANNGNIVTVWREGNDLYARVYNGADGDIKTRFQIATGVSSTTERDFSVDADGNGNFVVVWSDGDDIKAQEYDSTGTSSGSQITINDTTAGTQVAPDVSMDSFGNYAVAWMTYDDGGTNTIYSKVYDAGGVVIDAETSVATTTDDPRINNLHNHVEPRIALNNFGDFGLAWTTYDGGTTSNEVFADITADIIATPNTTATWGGGTGNWNVDLNWDEGAFPRNGTPGGSLYDVIIDGGKGASHVDLTAGSNYSITRLKVESGDVLDMNDNSVLNLSGPTSINNAGEIQLNSVGNVTSLSIIGGDLTLSGGGVISMGTHTQNRIESNTSSYRLTNVDNTIQGGGALLFNELRLTNSGLVQANISGIRMLVDPINGSNGVINNGTMQAANGGSLRLNAGTFNNANGLIQALAGSTVELVTATIQGGTLGVGGAGTIQSLAGTQIFDGSASGITLNGNFVSNDNTTVSVTGTLTHTGAWNMNSVGNATNFNLIADTTLGGVGTIFMNTNEQNRIVGNINTRRLTLTSDRVIEGRGQVGVNSLRVTNDGLIHANDSGARITIDPTDGADGFINTGTLRASSSGTMRLNTGSYNNVGGLIEALAGSQVELVGSVIQGGTLSTTGSGVFEAIGASQTLDGSANAITFNGNMVQVDNADVFLNGSLTHNGTWNLNSIGNATDIRLSGDTTVDGTGTFDFNNNTQNRIRASSSLSRLILESGRVIEGAGQIGVNSLKLTNRGLIDANETNSLTFDPTNGDAQAFINAGTFRATSGPLILNQGTYQNFEGITNGLIQANAARVEVNSSLVNGGSVSLVGAGTVELNTGTISGGTVTNSSTGVIRADSGTSLLSGTVTNVAGGQIIINQNSTLRFDNTGTYVNAGTISFDSNGNASRLDITGGDVSLSGGGTLTFDSDQNNTSIRGTTNTFRFTNVDQTINGRGSIGVNTMRFTNQSLVDANVSAQRLYIDPTDGADGVINTGTLQSSGGGFLRLVTGTYNNVGGLIQALASSEVELSGSTIQGGTLGVASAGTIRTIGATQTLDASSNAITLNGNIAQNNNTDFNVTGTLTHTGAWSLNSIGNQTDINLTADTTLNGVGTIFMNTNQQNRIKSSSAHRLTLSSDRVIEGQGLLGFNSLKVTNAGLVHANDSGKRITVDPSAGTDSFINTGTLRASSSGTLLLNAGTIENNGGLIEALAGSQVELSGFRIQGGTLSTTGTGIIEGVGGTNRLDGSINTVLINGNVVSNNNIDFDVLGTITHNGLWTMSSVGNQTDFRVVGDTTLNGTGTHDLSNNIQNRFNGSASSRLTLESGRVIEGAGQIGVNNMRLTNRGLIDADNTLSLTIDPINGVNGVVNSGTMRSTNGPLIFNAGTIENFEGLTNGLVQANVGRVEINSSTVNGGSITVVGAGTVELNTATIQSGTVTNSSTGVIRADSGTSLLTGTVTNVAGGQIIINQNSTLRFDNNGTYVNAGTISFDSNGNASRLDITGGDVYISGGGTHTFDSYQNNTSIRATTNTFRFTNVDQTINGRGSIGVNTMRFTNQSLVDANVSGQRLYINPTDGVNGVINTGTLQASNNGTLYLEQGTYNNAGGLIQAAAGSEVELTTATIQGGTLGVASGGTVQLLSGTQTFDGSSGGIILNGNFAQNDNADVNVVGTLTHTGAWNMNSVGNSTEFNLTGDTTLNGVGTILMNINEQNKIKGSSSHRLTLSSDRVFEGRGTFGNNQIKVTNDGLIHANDLGARITFDPVTGADGLINTGTIQASGGGIARLGVGTFNNAGGLIQALTGSEVELSSARIEGGTLSSSGTGFIEALSGTTILDGSTNAIVVNGSMNQNDNVDFSVMGTLTNNADWDMKSVGNATDISIAADSTLDGTGTITMGTSHATQNRFEASTGGVRLTIGASQTIQGRGQMSVNDLKITNNGLISATTGAITIDPPTGADGFINNGTLQANGGAVTFNAGTYTNNGLFKATGTSTLDLTARAIDGTGGYTADNGTINFGAFTYGDTGATGDLIGQNGGSITLTGSTVNVNDVTLDTTSSLTVNSEIVATGNFLYQITTPGDFDLDGASSGLVMNGVAAGPTDFANFKQLEIGGSDLGNTPFNKSSQPVPDVNAAGFTNNFSITNLTIGPGAHVQLVDLYNNATGGGLGDEALYVDTLTIQDSDSRLLLNGNSLYFNTLVLNGGAVLNDSFVTSVLNTRSGEHDNNTNWQSDAVTNAPNLLWADITQDGDTSLTQLTTADGEYALVEAADITIVETTAGDLSLFDVSTTALFNGNVLVRIPLADLGVIPNNLSVNELFGIHVTGGQALRVAGAINGGFFEFSVPNFSGVGVGVNPEPSTIIMLLLSSLGLAFRKIKK